MTVKIPREVLRRFPRSETRSEFIREAVAEKLAKLASPQWKPKTDLGRQLVELRRDYVSGGGELLDAEGIASELRERRGGLA